MKSDSLTIDDMLYAAVVERQSAVSTYFSSSKLSIEQLQLFRKRPSELGLHRSTNFIIKIHSTSLLLYYLIV